MGKRNYKTICVDFDGVIHHYTIGDWRDGELYGEPFEGAIAALFKLKNRGFKVVIFTTRAMYAEQRDKIRWWIYENSRHINLAQTEPFTEWLKTNNDEDFPFLVTNEKVPAIAYVDDRAIRFVNWPDTLKYFV